MTALRFKDEKSFTYLRFNWISNSPMAIAISKRLADRCKADRGRGIREVKVDFSSAFNVVLTSLEVSGAYGLDEWIRVVTDNEVYGGRYQRSASHNRKILTSLLWLISQEYLSKVDGRRFCKYDNESGGIDLPFAYVISEKWRTEISAEPISKPNEVYRNPLSAYIQLRARESTPSTSRHRSVSLQITAEQRAQYSELIKGTETLLSAADEIWRRVNISIDDRQIPSMQATMTRIFNNGSFEFGGRFYCQLQNISRLQRTKIRFDNEPTVEIDFAALHPHLLYNLQGEEFEGDPYFAEGFHRNDVKAAFNILINRDKSKHKSSEVDSIASNLRISKSESQKLLSTIYNFHHRIERAFNTGCGLTLQRIDSEIAYHVMKLFYTQIDRPLLMIHDSAIVSVRDVESLMLCMVDSYRDVVANEIKGNGLNMTHNTYFLPKLLKITSIDFSSTLTNTIYRALGGDDVSHLEWTAAISSS